MTEDLNDELMNCKELVELVTTYLEDVMDAVTRTRFEAHLESCPGCRNYLEQFRITVHTVGRIHDDDLDPAFRTRLLEAFRRWR